MLDQRGMLLMAAAGFAGCSLPSYDRGLWALRMRLDSWPGIGYVVAGMHRQGYDLQLTQYDDRGSRATFYTTGMEHSPTIATGTGWERSPGTRRRRERKTLMNTGESCGTRTHDPLIKSRGPVKAGPLFFPRSCA